jgi:hypothetical protein
MNRAINRMHSIHADKSFSGSSWSSSALASLTSAVSTSSEVSEVSGRDSSHLAQSVTNDVSIQIWVIRLAHGAPFVCGAIRPFVGLRHVTKLRPVSSAVELASGSLKMSALQRIEEKASAARIQFAVRRSVLSPTYQTV